MNSDLDQANKGELPDPAFSQKETTTASGVVISEDRNVRIQNFVDEIQIRTDASSHPIYIA